MRASKDPVKWQRQMSIVFDVEVGVGQGRARTQEPVVAARTGVQSNKND